MKKSVEKVFIGKDINGTALASLVILGSGANLAEGELVVLNKNHKVLAAGSTYADTDTIFVIEGMGDTYDYVNEAGSSVSGVRRYRLSDPIQGNAVTEYSGVSYTAPVEKEWSINFTNFVPVINATYRIRLIFKDLPEHPGQSTKTYSYTATTATLDTEIAAIAALINADNYRKVDASYNTSTNVLKLTGRKWNNDNTVGAIDEYRQTNFSVFLISDNFTNYTSSAATVNPFPGAGYWKQVRDEEKWAEGYEGITNRTVFPVISPTMRTVKDQTYDTVVIRHKNWYTNVQGVEEQVDITTKIFLPDSAGQTTKILDVLNPWMMSLPRGFSSISL